MIEVKLIGGPCDGRTVQSTDGRTPLQVTGPPIDDGFVAVYRPRDARRAVSTEFTFRGVEKILASIELP